MTTKTYYIIYDDSWGQHGTDIISLQLTEEEYTKRVNTHPRNYFITDNYISALFYIQD